MACDLEVQRTVSHSPFFFISFLFWCCFFYWQTGDRIVKQGEFSLRKCSYSLPTYFARFREYLYFEFLGWMGWVAWRSVGRSGAGLDGFEGFEFESIFKRFQLLFLPAECAFRIWQNFSLSLRNIFEFALTQLFGDHHFQIRTNIRTW